MSCAQDYSAICWIRGIDLLCILHSGGESVKGRNYGAIEALPLFGFELVYGISRD